MFFFATAPYHYLLEALKPHFQPEWRAGKLTEKQFPDGEVYHRIGEELEGQVVTLIGGLHDDAATLALYDLACGIVSYGAKRLNLFIPYFGYSTMERAVKSGEIVKAKTRARLLSSVPQAYYGNRAFFVDLHVGGIAHYFEGAIHTEHLYAKPLILEAAQTLAQENFVLASTDAGRAKWVESLANDLGVPAAFVYKQRLSGHETAVTGVNADVKGKKVVIYDDMIRTGGSLVQAAKAYKDAGATEIFVIATHGVLPEGALARIQNSGLIKKVCVTDSHPSAVAQASDFLQVRSLASLFARALI